MTVQQFIRRTGKEAHFDSGIANEPDSARLGRLLSPVSGGALMQLAMVTVLAGLLWFATAWAMDWLS